MTQIVLTPDQIAILGSAKGLVAISRPDGSFVGWISPGAKFIIPEKSPFTAEEVAAAERDADNPGPLYTTREVLDHLRSLEDS